MELDSEALDLVIKGAFEKAKADDRHHFAPLGSLLSFQSLFPSVSKDFKRA
jgi:hypothetical protein